jgi:glyoxylase-like metal-dependent hydrolase (beta-lactamase superfamily II)
MDDYIRSLEKLRRLKLRVLLPGHGPMIEDPYGKIDEYIAHRLDRERQVLNALRSGEHTIPSITSRIYADIPAALISMAQLTVEAHLLKLIKEKRVDNRQENYFERAPA